MVTCKKENEKHTQIKMLYVKDKWTTDQLPAQNKEKKLMKKA
jgi:hypothetical protein